MTPHHFTIEQTGRALRSKEISATELIHYFLQRITKMNAILNAFISVNEETALDQAKQLDERIASGCVLAPLAGVPLAIKDLFDVEGMPSTYGGRHFVNHLPATTATSVRRLLAAGAIVIGKTNLHEYAYGTTTENPHFGNTRNPWNRAKIPGGSSGGTSVSIVSGCAIAGLGTDTGGSVRIPAALTGHVGLKPTFGAISKYGVFPLADSLDHVGPMTKTVHDSALLFEAMVGYDPLDKTSVRTPMRATSAPLAKPLQDIRLGVPRQFFFDKCHANVTQVIHQALQQLERAGVTLIEIDIPGITDVPEAQNVLISCEAADVHRELLNHPEAYGTDVLRRLELGQSVPGHELIRVMRFQKEFRQGVAELFQGDIDALVTPTTPITATDIGQSKAHIKAIEVNVRGHLTRYTNPWNFSGLPAISLPCGLAADGLPVGLQLVGSAFSEPTLLQTAAAIEQCFEWNPIAPQYC